jgi:predicted nucleotidyltransferase
MTTKVMVSFPDEFLAEVDRVAQEEHRSRSELVREALRLYIGLRHDRSQAGLGPQAGPHPGRTQDRRAGATAVREAPGGAYQALTEQDQRIARTFKQRLSTIAPVRDLRVFGSRVRGDATPHSDLDLFIELEETSPELRKRISEIAWEVGFEMGRVISTVVVSRDDLENGAMGANPLVVNVEREGIRL